MDPNVLQMFESHDRTCKKDDEAMRGCPMCQLAIGMVSAKESGVPPHLYLGVVVELINYVWDGDADLPSIEMYLVPTAGETH